ncbi:MAG: extracellular solute-binding protein [Thomasclavelia sp.]|uniref:extracellular solute-binding protein n=1 Tax=Thomasclavelia sp. TaxID=3025757 RepID=UPI00399FD1D5
MKKLKIIMCMCLIFIIVGCQGKKEDILDKDNPTTISIWHYYNGAQQEAFNKLVTEFNETVGKEKGIVVESASQGTVSDLEENVMNSINGKAGADEIPNIFAAYGDTAYQVDKLDYAVDLTKYFTEKELDKYVDGYIEEGRFLGDGSLKIFPIAKSTEILMLNQTDWDIFANETGAVIDELQTIEGVTKVAKQYYEWTDAKTAAPNDGKAFFGRDANANYMIIGYHQLANEMFEVEKGQVKLNFERDVVKKLWDNYFIPYINGYFNASGRFRSDDMKTGNIIACVGSSSSATYLPKEVILNDEDSYPIEIAMMPSPKFANGADYAVQQGAGMVVTKSNDKEQLASIEFLKWFTQDEQNIQFAMSSSYLPVTKNANNIEKISENIELKGNVKKSLISSLETTKDNKMYTTKAFEKGTTARSIMENSMSALAKEVREQVIANLNAGMSLQEATASFTSDEYFDTWYNQVKSQLEELVK